MCVQQKDTVAEEGKHDEEDGEDHARVYTTLGLNAVVHHHVPVLSCQDLSIHTHTHTHTHTHPHTHNMHTETAILCKLSLTTAEWCFSHTHTHTHTAGE